MLNVVGTESKCRSRGRRARPGVWALWGLLGAVVVAGAACSDDDGDGGGGACPSGQEGAVAGPEESHCEEADGTLIARPIGACVTAAEAAPAEGEEEEEHAEEHAEEEEHAVLNGREAYDDECKYRVRFENTCVTLNEPVTFTLSLTRSADGQPGTGALPNNPEIYLPGDQIHVTPSNDITSTEGPPGTYRIGPVIFDRPGRWVVRFHYFDTCSEVPEDSPHSHVAFNFDVP